MTNKLLKIDKCVPIPDPNKGRNNKYPFMDMKVGDSFFVRLHRDTCAAEYRIRQSKLISAARGITKYHGKKYKFTTKATVGAGIRIWRVE